MNLNIFDTFAPAIIQAFLLEEERRRKAAGGAMRLIAKAQRCKKNSIARIRYVKKARAILERWVSSTTHA